MPKKNEGWLGMASRLVREKYFAPAQEEFESSMEEAHEQRLRKQAKKRQKYIALGRQADQLERMTKD